MKNIYDRRKEHKKMAKNITEKEILENVVRETIQNNKKVFKRLAEL